MRRLLVLLLTFVLAACGSPYTYQAIRPVDEPKPAPDFTLIDHTGAPFRLSEQSGKVRIMFFGFTSCPDICPTTLSDMAYVRRELGADAAKVQMIFVTVDPQRDTPAKLASYLPLFDADFVGLTGGQTALDGVMRDYGVAARRVELPDSALGYTMDHSASIYIIDGQGRWFGMFSHGADLKPFIADLRHLVDA